MVSLEMSADRMAACSLLLGGVFLSDVSVPLLGHAGQAQVRVDSYVMKS